MSHISQGEIVKEGRRIIKTLSAGVGRVICYSPTEQAYQLEIEGVKMLLGYWWVQDCIGGGPSYCPVVNIKPVVVKQA